MPRSGIPPILALLSLAAGSLRCSDDSGPEEVAECSGPVAVTVTAGAVPSFSWTPRCSLFFLLVEPAESGSDVWSVITRSENGLVPPVRYGQVPPGAEELEPDTPLESGTEYDVVARWTGPGDDDGEAIGTGTFTP